MQQQNYILLNELQRAQISDLADGQLHGSAFADAMALLDTSSSARAAWYGLHTVGDVLRGEVTDNSANSTKDMVFLDTFRANLAQDVPLSQRSTLSRVIEMAEPANQSLFNWKWATGLSAVAAAFVLSWNLVGTTAVSPPGSGTQLAQVLPVATQTSAGVMLRSPQLDALIAAHNQVGGSSALQMPSGFLRSATFNPAAATALADK